MKAYEQFELALQTVGGALLAAVAGFVARAVRKGRPRMASLPGVLLGAVQRLSCAVLVFDSEQNLTFSSSSFERVFGGRSAEKFDWRRYIHPEDVETLVQFQGELLQAGTTGFATVATRYLSPDGRWLKTVWHCVMASDGSTVALVWNHGYAGSERGR